jgi:putative molybdopterin biosynthesis protein
VKLSDPNELIGDIPLEEALERWLSDLEFHRQKAQGCETQLVDVEDAVGRTTAETVVAKLNSPSYYAAATDGLAVASHNTVGASPAAPIKLSVGTGLPFVDTGSPMPAGCDTVVPFNELNLTDERLLEVRRPSAPWRNVRPIGEDLAAGEVILPKGYRVRSMDLSALIAGGIREMMVEGQPRVHVLPLGEALVEPGRLPSVGQTVDHTSPLLAALATEQGLRARRFPAIPESRDAVTAAMVEQAARCDLLILCAGHERGTALIATALAEAGECTLHGVAIRPGHSLVLGFLKDTPVLGLSSHPVPAFLGFSLFGLPIFKAHFKGRAKDEVWPWPRDRAKLAIGCDSAAGVEEFLRVKMAVVDGERIAVAESGGHGTLMTLVRADGLIRIPSAVRHIDDGADVEVLRLREDTNLTGHMLILGTHDISYDLIRDRLHDRYPQVRLHTAATGGKAGLQALRRGQCHGAAVHLFDESSGQYNLPFLQSWDWQEPVVVFQLLHRWLGLAVAPGNPLGIQGLQDLTRDGIRFVNRQPSSGTRQLIDYHLAAQGVSSSSIRGYDLHAHTHMAIAAAVKGDMADAGPTISTAARSLGLDFVPCVRERLDLVFPKRFLSLYPLRALLAVLRSETFRTAADDRFHDYDFAEAGELVWESP